MAMEKRMRELAKAGADAEAIADAVLADPELRQELRLMVVWRAVQVVRSSTRRVEQRFPPSAIASPTARKKLVGCSFALPDGTFVAWVDATPEQHEQRAAWQRKLAGACLADAERHEAAARFLRETGVACLAELDKKKAA